MREDRLHIGSMPEEIQTLCEVMTGLDPSWTLEEWLIQQSKISLELVSADIAHEKVKFEQRIKRLEDLSRRIKIDNHKNNDINQKNLFDCFDLEYDKSMLGLGSRAVENENTNNIDSHPANTLPDSQGDDPLLAVACQLLLMTIEKEIAKGEPVATLETIVLEMDGRGVSFEEIDEAIEYLLMNGSIIEVDDDCFISI